MRSAFVKKFYNNWLINSSFFTPLMMRSQLDTKIWLTSFSIYAPTIELVIKNSDGEIASEFLKKVDRK